MERLVSSRRGLRAGKSLASETARQIKQFIIANNLQPGDPLPSESDLCERLGVSRSSVREAIRTLTTLEIVDVRHGRGTFVGQASLQPLVETLAFRAVLVPGDDFRALRELVEVRMQLDLGQAERVCSELSGTRNEELYELAEAMCRAADRGEGFEAQDRRFHTLLFRLTGLEIISQLVAAFWDVHAAVVSQLSIPTLHNTEATARAHSDMVQAAEAGDVEAYCTAVREHYAPLQQVLASGRRGIG